MSDVCNACGRAKPADRFRACPECRKAWRLSARKPGGHADVAEALAALVAEIDGLAARGALYPTGFPRFNGALFRAKSVLKARRAPRSDLRSAGGQA